MQGMKNWCRLYSVLHLMYIFPSIMTTVILELRTKCKTITVGLFVSKSFLVYPYLSVEIPHTNGEISFITPLFGVEACLLVSTGSAWFAEYP